jgi:hypothetical protein
MRSYRNLFAIRIFLTVCLLAAAMSFSVAHAEKKTLIILEPKTGATVTSPFKLRLGVTGMKVRPAGEVVEGTGHYVLLIDHGPVTEGKIIPADDRHLHFDKGETEVEVSLPPGKYKLLAQFADGAQRSYGHMLSHGINVIVK